MTTALSAGSRTGRTRISTLPEVRWAALATALFVAGLSAQWLGAPAWLWWALYLACYACGGWEPLGAGLNALRDKTLDVDLLMIVAALGAAAIGQIFDGALLIVIFATSGALEAVLTQRTADSVRSLLHLAPDRATVVDDSGRERVVDAADLAPGAVIVVRPGERIGADGTVVAGDSDVDQASITGEPLPAPKRAGDEVFAGTVNGTGMLRVRVERDASDFVVARIVAMVERASATKAKAQLFVERVEQWYSTGVIAATVAILLIPLAFGAPLQSALLRAMTFMIVASPCAVVLATMPPLLAAMATAGRHGVLVKSAIVMERLGGVTTVAFDKTGTLTRGEPRLADIVCGDTALGSDRLLALAAAAEHSSEHPIARAIVTAARKRGLELPHATNFESLPGQGVRATVGGLDIRIGSPARLFSEIALAGVTGGEPGRSGNVEGESAWTAEAEAGNAAAERLPAPAREAIIDAESAGKTAVVVMIEGAVAGVLAVADQPRPEAADAVRALTRLTASPPVLLTGDNPRAAATLAGQVGISDVRARLLPQDKVAAVTALENDGHRVAVVGDGVNDAPALAAAHTGIAMGRNGSDLALDTADVVLVRDDLTAVPAVIALSRRAKRIVVANLALAATFIAVLVVWDLAGHLPLPLGVAGHEGSTVLVGLNGMRLLASRAWTGGRGPSSRTRNQSTADSQPPSHERSRHSAAGRERLPVHTGR
ncbi:heavy metal translocating P-type ATPase [Nocardia transvalensis]|uniref:Heavy metal translocating P-type ATPase n=1 Tax=Nocardia transvalensis TaxID=37333 RepID=A0A7W9PIU2_9NOCA|nr:heavy metal translocating P-type ATPase [Nocardia transvalensis]MBB5916896.1 heavy metal translocating P-type ATPase [Nocardia transvalensis]